MTAMMELSIDEQELVKRELASGEQLQWVGKPVAKVFTRSSVAVSAFGAVWTCGVLFSVSIWNSVGVWDDGMVWESLFHVPFVLVGVGLMCYPLWAYWKARRTVYAVTDRRGISFEGGWSLTTRSYRSNSRWELTRREYGDGTGDLVIERRVVSDSEGSPRTEELGFFRIREVREVEKMLESLKDAGPNE